MKKLTINEAQELYTLFMRRWVYALFFSHKYEEPEKTLRRFWEHDIGTDNLALFDEIHIPFNGHEEEYKDLYFLPLLEYKTACHTYYDALEKRFA